RNDRTAPSIGERSLPVAQTGWSPNYGREGASPAVPTTRNCIAVAGAVNKPGCYELPTVSISVWDLMKCCGGLNSKATGTLAVVRNGKPLGLVYNPQDRLLAGDVVIAGETADPSSGVRITSHGERSRRDSTLPGVQLGLVNLIDHPVAVMVPASHATVAGVLEIANQKHLRPGDVKVVMAGTDEVFGDQAGELTPGSVLVFDPRSIDAQALSEIETNYYSTSPSPSELMPSAPMQIAPSLRSPDLALANPADAQQALHQPIEDVGFGAFPQPGLAPPPPAPEDLSSLPSVEMLDAPDDETLRFPRTADASGAIPLGAPEASSHIVPIPSDAIYDTPSQPAASPVLAAAPVPPPVTLPVDDAATEESTKDSPSFEELAPTVFLGTILGAATFFALRRWRGRQMLTTFISRLRMLPQTIRSSRIADTAAPHASTPNDMLAALIADRLAFREEPVSLPEALRIHGRSPALRNRRVDPPAAAAPPPHIPMTAPITLDRNQNEAFDDDLRSGPNAKTQQSSIRVDPPQLAGSAIHHRATGTPFERALAAKQTRRQQSGSV
nr:SLBB domain-containing protein [Planctomycetota bacterium]